MTTWARMDDRARDAWLKAIGVHGKWEVMTNNKRNFWLSAKTGLWANDGSDGTCFVPYEFTTDSAAALQLAEEMRNDWVIALYLKPYGYEARFIHIGVDADDLPRSYEEEADMLALAIAHAAYLALGGE